MCVMIMLGYCKCVRSKAVNKYIDGVLGLFIQLIYLILHLFGVTGYLYENPMRKTLNISCCDC